MLRVLAYKLQAQRLGDLDKGSQRELAAALGKRVAPGEPSRVGAGAGSSREAGAACAPVSAGWPSRPVVIARPGTLLVREHGGVLHRAMVLNEGFAWNGKTYDSLSQVAFAITGTKWNGPRFFGLRVQTKRGGDRPPRPSSADPSAAIRRRGAPKARSSLGSRTPS